MWCFSCTWREGRHGDRDVDRERVDVVDIMLHRIKCFISIHSLDLFSALFSKHTERC